MNLSVIKRSCGPLRGINNISLSAGKEIRLTCKVDCFLTSWTQNIDNTSEVNCTKFKAEINLSRNILYLSIIDMRDEILREI